MVKDVPFFLVNQSFVHSVMPNTCILPILSCQTSVFCPFCHAKHQSFAHSVMPNTCILPILWFQRFSCNLQEDPEPEDFQAVELAKLHAKIAAMPEDSKQRKKLLKVRAFRQTDQYCYKWNIFCNMN